MAAHGLGGGVTAGLGGAVIAGLGGAVTAGFGGAVTTILGGAVTTGFTVEKRREIFFEEVMKFEFVDRQEVKAEAKWLHGI